MRRYVAAAAALIAATALTAPAAQADSIVYERGGNVWLANPDGTGQRQVTFSGGYSRPSQSDDGTIVAAKGNLLERLDRFGRVLNQAGDDDYGGKIFTDLAPNGALASYGFFANGPILEGPYAAVSHAARPTPKEEIDGPLKGYLNPSWLDDSTLLLFPQSLIVDVQYWPVPGNVQDWFTDPDYDLGGGEADRAQTRFAATADGGARMLIYRMPGPPPALPQRLCQVTGAVGSFFRPTWSPDGSRLAWQEDDGLHVMSVDLATCQGQSELVVPGARHPDWGPADVGAPALAASAPKRIRLGALLRGLKVKVTCSCRATATLLLARKAIGRATKQLAGSGTVRVRPNAKGKRRLRRGGKSVSVRVSTPGRSVTRKVKVVRPAASAAAVQPLFADTWDYEMQSTRYRGPAGHFEGTMSFRRPNIVLMRIPRYGASKPRPLRPRRGWLVATFSERRRCFSVPGGKVNVYRYRQVLRFRPTKVHDMEGELVASAARFVQSSSTKPCIGRRIAGTFKGRAERQVGPERGTADIGYNEGPSCDEALVEHFANEGDSFVDWDLPVISYQWTFSDGGTATGREPVHRYPGPGTHSATVLMRSINGSVAKGTEAIEVSSPDPDCN